MNKTAIKNFAIWARVQLIESAKQRAYEYEITENGENNPNLDSVGGRLLSKIEKEQRIQLINQIRQKGYTQVMEEAAYTWFNRFIALRFIEVNGYLPSKVRVFTDESGAFKPEILKEAMTIELDGLDRQLVFELLDKQDNEALYKHLLIAQCNTLNAPLPYMFERIANWTELLFPANLLRPDSVVGTMVSSIPEEDWTDAVQIIGWLYQYYNSELKDETFALLKNNVKITKERIPAATQLFTPDWIVRYMVENSLGRLWYEGHNDFDKSGWKYYLDEAEQEPEVEQQLAAIRAEYAGIKPEEIKVIDPCMGSGHILVYAFDVLMQIYTAAGWSERDAVKSILLNNLYGLDIDDRAGQLAYFAVMMKAQQYDHRWLSRQARDPIQLNVFALQNSGSWPAFEQQMRQAFMNHPSNYEEAAIRTAKTLFADFANAKEFGSIIQPKVTLEDLDILDNVLDDMMRQTDLMDLAEQANSMTLLDKLLPLIRQARALVQKYHVAVTNPPYLGIKSINESMADYLSIHYADTKFDVACSFVERMRTLVHADYLFSAIVPQAMSFAPTFAELRDRLLNTTSIVSFNQLGLGVFGSDRGTVSFINRLSIALKYISKGVTLESAKDSDEKALVLMSIHDGKNQSLEFIHEQSVFSQIPNTPFGFTCSPRLLGLYSKHEKITDYGVTRQGLATSDNNRFVRLWHEVQIANVCFNAGSAKEASRSGKRWFPFNKGGGTRRWYGNLDYIVDWSNDGKEMKNLATSLYKSYSRTIKNEGYYFIKSITWSDIGTIFSGREYPQGGIFSTVGLCMFTDEELFYQMLGYLNSKVTLRLLTALNPTIHFNVGDIALLPYLPTKDGKVEAEVKECIDFAKNDWDSFETSWDFQKHPLVRPVPSDPEARTVANSQGDVHIQCPVEHAFTNWLMDCEERFTRLKANEEELNRIFIDIYGLQDELTPEVDDKDVTVRRADLGRDIRSLISYAVGCILGRYSLDKPGLAFAGGTWDKSLYKTFLPDQDGILPISDDEYFDGDIVGMFVNWVCTVYGADTLEENLRFIANSLGGKGTPREVIRHYFLNDFYADHLKVYQKRPIYWLFSSGKKNGFKCLVYMHRYQPDLLARIRTDYVHEQQERYRTQLIMLEDSLQTARASERIKLNKQITKIKDQALELQQYEEKIHHLADQMIPIDLDDGVKVNYAKFQDVLEKIK